MSALRKPALDEHGAARVLLAAPPEAFDYDEPLNPAEIEKIRQVAAERLGDKPRRVVDGINWAKMRELVKEPA